MVSVQRVGLVAAISLVCLSLGAGPGAAQSFFEQLFGLGGSAPPRPQPRLAPPSWDYRALPPPPANRREPAPAARSGSGSYRTLCVRMCDGYYWPVNYSVSRRGFHDDAKMCASSCSSEARLFYHDKSSGDASSMVDLSGRAYARLPTAFRYRTAMVPGCRCKPDPWSASERQRHLAYGAGTTPATLAASATSDEARPPEPTVLAGAASMPTVPSVASTAPPPGGEADATETVRSPESPAGPDGASILGAAVTVAVPPATATTGAARLATASAAATAGKPSRARPAVSGLAGRKTATNRGRGRRLAAQASSSVRPIQRPAAQPWPGLLGLGAGGGSGGRLRWPGD